GELWSALRGQRTNWAVVRRMARSLMDPDYTLSDFNQDLSAFPELSLYLRDSPQGSATNTSSSRTVGDEYQRTVGAFFAVYWLMRIDHDGRDGFTFGVDNRWVPLKATLSKDAAASAVGAAEVPQDAHQRLFSIDRRMTFVKDARWDFFRRLLFD
ncbi:unnamed protein product, partial [Polarella glacialis]